MKKTAAIFLLFIFLFNIMGYFFAFKAVNYQVKKEIKKQIKHGIPDKELTIIVIKSSESTELTWIESDEFIYKEEMYDVIKSEISDKTTIYKCLKDTQEKKLFAHLDEHIEKHIADNKPLKNKAAQNLKQHIVKLYFSTTQLFFFYFSENSNPFSWITICYTPALKESTSPPPEKI